MSFPGGRPDQGSFGEIKGKITSHEVSKAPAMGKYKDCTIAQYSNIVGGEEGAKDKPKKGLYKEKM